MRNFTTKGLEELKSKGKIRGYTMPVGKPRQEPRGRIVVKHFHTHCPPKDYIASNFLKWCNERAVVMMEDVRFDPDRKFEFDYAAELPWVKLAIEYEGGIRHIGKGGHTNFKGIQRDVEKYNLAHSLGWTVLRFHSINYEELLPTLEKLEHTLKPKECPIEMYKQPTNDRQ